MATIALINFLLVLLNMHVVTISFYLLDLCLLCLVWRFALQRDKPSIIIIPYFACLQLCVCMYWWFPNLPGQWECPLHVLWWGLPSPLLKGVHSV